MATGGAQWRTTKGGKRIAVTKDGKILGSHPDVKLKDLVPVEVRSLGTTMRITGGNLSEKQIDEIAESSLPYRVELSKGINEYAVLTQHTALDRSGRPGAIPKKDRAYISSGVSTRSIRMNQLREFLQQNQEAGWRVTRAARAEEVDVRKRRDALARFAL